MYCNRCVATIAVFGLSFGCGGTEGPVTASGSGGRAAHQGGATTSTGGQVSNGGVTSSLGGSSAPGGSEATGGGQSATAGGSNMAGGNAAGGSRLTNGSTARTSSGATSSGGAHSSSGGSVQIGGTAGIATTGGQSAAGGSRETGGIAATGGQSAAGGSRETGGIAATGGRPTAGGSSATGGGTSASGCDEGTTSTVWATDCPTAPPSACTPGSWVAGGPDHDHSNFQLCSESEHFAVYSDEACTASAQTAVTHLESVWSLYFGSPMYMREPLCNVATKYKASVHVHSDWGLTGGSWATNRMGMWIGTGGLTDHWGLAHEFMHGVQAVQGGMSCNQSNTCGWVYESHANWAAQQQAEYHTKNLHCSEMLANAPHLYLGSTRNRYCNWQFLEFLKDKYCFSAVNALWTGTPSNDPFSAIMNSRGWSISQLNDFFGEWAMHNVTWDYQDPAPQSTAGSNQGELFRSSYGLLTDTSKPERRLRLVRLEPLDLAERRFVVPALHAPQRWGYNLVRLYPDSGANAVTVTFRGVLQTEANPDFRWGLVATEANLTTPRYSRLQSGTDGSLTFCVGSGETMFEVVTATPSVHKQIDWDQSYPSIHRYPYMIQLSNAWPDGFQGGVPSSCPSGTVRVSNGGGCGPANLPATVYVGPYAQVLGGTVSGSARIDDHAIVLGGTISGGTVTGLTIVKSGMTIGGGTASVAWPYAPGYFETPQSLSGAAQLLGDIEYRGVNLSKSSGSYCGFVDGTTNSNCSGTDVTQPPPYSWRP